MLGKETIGALSAGPGYRARQLAVAMERLRWLQRDPPKTRIDVNTAASFLDYWRDGQHVDHRKVINGEADKPTPQLQAPIVRLVAKPTWNMPEGHRAKRSSRPRARLAASNDYVMKNGKYVQQSGPKNSLGLVKFDMDDDEAIYLHDTPAKARVRACPTATAATAASGSRMRSSSRPRSPSRKACSTSSSKAMQKDDETFIKLPNEIPVRLLYQTAFWDGSRIQFRPDVYGWDKNIAKALELAPGPPQKIEQPESSDDIGP